MKKVKTIGIVSLSSGILGEDFVLTWSKNWAWTFRVNLAFKLNFMETWHAKDWNIFHEHPKDRASDLLNAFQDDSIDMILCAIGGEDTYRLLPYLFEHDELKNAVKRKRYSLDFPNTTFNHFMFT